MKVLKKNQVIIFVIALMLIAAGYLNFTTNNPLNMDDYIKKQSNKKHQDKK